ncbi:MAG: SDR family oxidoreductase [Xanthobacteraceae bacterium]|jgi:NAD(P)-dependent dehydrogenase (short-subunit alcohol dehydrogenase family)
MVHGSNVAIVTGSGRGIGAAIVKGLAEDGYAVAVNYIHNEAAASQVVSEIKSAGGIAFAIQADISKDADVVRLFAAVDRNFGTLTALINNGGVTGKFGRVEELSAATLESVFSVNVIGAFLCCREAVRRMSTRNGGSGGNIVNISSRAAQIGGAGEWIHYAATKGALDTLTIGLAREVAAEGIRVNAVAPGLIDTELHAAAGIPDRMQRLAPTVPMGRPGTADEVAGCVRFLLSPAAAYVTAAILPVSGGR